MMYVLTYRQVTWHRLTFSAIFCYHDNWAKTRLLLARGALYRDGGTLLRGPWGNSSISFLCVAMTTGPTRDWQCLQSKGHFIEMGFYLVCSQRALNNLRTLNQHSHRFNMHSRSLKQHSRRFNIFRSLITLLSATVPHRTRRLNLRWLADTVAPCIPWIRRCYPLSQFTLL